MSRTLPALRAAGTSKEGIPVELELSLPLSGLVLGFTIAMAVGPISLLVVRRTIDHGMALGLASGVGVALADGTYAAIAAFGLTAITSLLLSAHTLLGVVGGAVIAVLGLRTMLARPAAAAPDVARPGLLRAGFSIYGLTLTNPLTMVLFAGAFASIGLAAGSSLVDAAVITGMVIAGSTLWWILLCAIVAWARDRVSVTALLWANRVSGAALVLFGVVAIIGAASAWRAASERPASAVPAAPGAPRLQSGFGRCAVALELAHEPAGIEGVPVLHELALPDPEEVHLIDRIPTARGLDPHEGAGVRRAAGEPGSHQVVLGDHGMDHELGIGNTRCRALHPFAEALPTGRHGTRGVRGEVRRDELIDRGILVVDEDPLDHLAGDVLVPLRGPLEAELGGVGDGIVGSGAFVDCHAAVLARPARHGDKRAARPGLQAARRTLANRVVAFG